MIDIIENGEQLSVSDEIALALRKADLTYDSGEGYDHLNPNITWHQVDKFIFNTVVANLPINRPIW